MGLGWSLLLLALVIGIVLWISGEEEPTTDAPEPTFQDKQREEMYKGENT